MRYLIVISLLFLPACQGIFPKKPELAYSYSAKKIKGIRHTGTLTAAASQDLKELKKAFDKESTFKCGKDVYLLDGMKEQSHMVPTMKGQEVSSYTLIGDFSCKPVKDFR